MWPDPQLALPVLPQPWIVDNKKDASYTVRHLVHTDSRPPCRSLHFSYLRVMFWRKKRADKVAESRNNIAVSDLVTVLTGELYFYCYISREFSASHLTPTGELLSTSNFLRGSCW